MTTDQSAKLQRQRIPLLPLRDILVFPSTVVPLFVGRDKSIQALEQAMSGSKEILLAAQIKAKTNDPTADDIYRVGTVSVILQLLRLPDGTVKVLVEGQRRARIVDYVQTEEFFMVEAEPLPEPQSTGVENEALIRTVKMAFDNYVRLNKRIPPEMLLSIAQIENESKLADTLVAHLTNLKLQDKQRLLEQTDPRQRLEDLYGFIQSEIEIMRVEKKIRARVKRQMEKTQKEYYLNEQMAAIQKELGDRDDGRAEIMELENLAKKKKLSEEARDKVNKEIRKLKHMSAMSAEATVVRNYIETVLSLPWNEYTTEKRDINFSRQVLDQDHFGLEKVKDRILEYLSVRALVSEMKGPILCLSGPPGVGKTSLAKSVAEATGRKFVRISLGGVRDEAEIRGHRRTYIGSMPGKIINALKKCGSANPVVLLDEVDKLSQDFRGDPTSALLEVLDPEQNATFVDHYLDIDFDLSKVMFMATANSLHTISKPLLDRMEVIRLVGYTEEEKLAIAKQYLVPKQLKTNGLAGTNVTVAPAAVKELVRYYTRESGVRNLEREIGAVLRKLARKHLEKHHSGDTSDATEHSSDSEAPEEVVEAAPVKKKKGTAAAAATENAAPAAAATGLIDLNITETVTDKSVQKYLGPRRFRIGLTNQHHEVGLCTGLAWTEVGGDLLVAEVSILPGKGKLTCTGKLGEVMQESAQAALSYVRSRSSFLSLDDDFYAKVDIHIHVPEGAIPKDGPSAGIAMATALTSALTNRPISKDVAMTGEITLRGRVLPIGGLKEKIIAAHRGGIKKVLIPKENEKDIQELPKQVLKEVTVVPVEHMDTVLMHALVWKQPEGASGQDELFEKLRKITETEVGTADLAFAH
ncbi:MAG: endopeptidase La [Deltaproteobacteria bacterium]|nr:endopeptidase La [Deltaproteobacteria bacterium]